MKTNFQRCLALLLCCVLLFGLLSGCGEQEPFETLGGETTQTDATLGSEPDTPSTDEGNTPTEETDTPTTQAPTTDVPTVDTPTGDTTPTNPANPTNPTNPIKPITPITPINPTNPTNPTTPTIPAPTDPKPTQPPSAQVPSVPEDPGYQPNKNDGIYDVGYEVLPYTHEELYTQLFNPNNKITIKLDMPASELQKLQQDYDHYRGFNSKSPIYRMADILITITTAKDSYTYRIFEVGVRMKGNTSRTDFYNDHDGIYKYIHLKLDFQETFEDESYYGRDAKVWSSKDQRKTRKNRTFATLEKLEMRWNKCADSTYLKESYAYDLYRSEGVLAPRANLCSFDWSGVHMGIYTINEPVDEVFLAKRLPAAELGGDLYKCGWVRDAVTFTNLNSVGIENEDKGEFYTYDLKSNKKTSQHESLKALITAMNSGNMTKERFAQLVDMDNFLSYAAVSYFLGNPDDLRNNYNNVYLYFLKSSGKAILIPYDYDRCLGVTYEWNPTGNGVTTDNPFADTMAGAEGGEDPKQHNPLFIYSVDMGGFYVREFADVLNRVAKNGLLRPEAFSARFNTAKKLYQNDVTPSKKLHNSGDRSFAFSLNSSFGGNLSFADYITKKMNSFRGYMAKVDQYVNYVRPEPVRCYIRGPFCDWNIRDEYAMKKENGVYTFVLRFNYEFKFKVYDQVTDCWYGSEAVSPETTVPYTSAGRTNVVLKAGTYKVSYDPETQLITITKL